MRRALREASTGKFWVVGLGCSSDERPQPNKNVCHHCRSSRSNESQHCRAHTLLYLRYAQSCQLEGIQRGLLPGLS